MLRIGRAPNNTTPAAEHTLGAGILMARDTTLLGSRRALSSAVATHSASTERYYGRSMLRPVITAGCRRALLASPSGGTFVPRRGLADS